MSIPQKFEWVLQAAEAGERPEAPRRFYPADGGILEKLRESHRGFSGQFLSASGVNAETERRKHESKIFALWFFVETSFGCGPVAKWKGEGLQSP